MRNKLTSKNELKISAFRVVFLANNDTNVFLSSWFKYIKLEIFGF